MVFWPPENRPQVNFCPNPVLLASGKWVSVKTAANSVVKSSDEAKFVFHRFFFVLLGNKFSKLIEIFGIYKETFYVYPIFSCKKIICSYIFFVRSGLTPWENNNFYVWDYYSSNYEIMFIQLYWIIKTNYMQIYIFMEKNKKQSNVSPPFNWQMKKKIVEKMLMVFISKDRKLILQS
jgi:hypothetical protein